MDADFFTGNRKSLMEALPGGLIVVTGYARMQRAHDMSQPFEQESNFWYLTGINEPDWQVIIDGAQGAAWLVAPHIDRQHEIFEGALSDTAAKTTSGIKSILSTEEADSLLRKLTKKHSLVYTIDHPSYAEMFNFTLNPALGKTRQKLERMFSKVQSCNKQLTKLRAIKQPSEIRMIEKAIKVTSDALSTVHDNLLDFRNEYEIEASLSYYFRKNGAKGHAYDPIVAAGKNACTLHYTENTTVLKKRQLVLLDVGARVGGYPADITRTYAYGEPTKRQKMIHQKVVEAHAAIIELLAPGISVEEYHKKVMDIMGNVLVELGLVSSAKDERVHHYFPHAISHGLGVDVHDELGKPRFFEPNMVLTVEPGIYIPEESIGVRIEDDILITASGHKNLSAGLSTQW